MCWCNIVLGLGLRVLYGGVGIVLAGSIRWGVVCWWGLGFRGFLGGRDSCGYCCFGDLVLGCGCWLDFCLGFVLLWVGACSFLWVYFVPCLVWVSRFWGLVLRFWLFSLFEVGGLDSED